MPTPQDPSRAIVIQPDREELELMDEVGDLQEA